mgnify:CR=1 FL=1
MGADQPWYRIGRKGRVNADDIQASFDRSTDSPLAPILMPTKRKSPFAYSAGALVARSQILVSGSTATLLGTMTNETGSDVHFSGTPPYARTLDSHGRGHVLFGDFNSPPREQPSSADWVMHPGASVPYRSLPVTLQDPDPRWDGTDWCASSQSSTLDIMTASSNRRLPMIQIIT